MKKIISMLLALALCLGLGGTALATTAPEDLFRPQAWFGDWADDYELINWDYYDDVGGLGLILGFRSEPAVAAQLFQAYADRLSGNDSLREMSRKEYESAYGEYDQEACYTYLGSSNVGSVTSLLGGTPCELTVDQVWLEDGYPRIVIAWGEGFPIQIDLDGIDILSAAVEPVSAPPAAGGGNVTYDAYSTYLPSPDAWFDGQLARGEDMEAHGGLLVSYYMALEDLPAIEAYVKLLEEDSRFQLKEVDSGEADFVKYTGQIFYSRYFDYTGSASTGTVDYAADREPCAVVVAYSEDFVRGACGMTVCYASEFTFVDDGDRWGGDVTDLSGGASSGGDLDLSDGGTDYSPLCSMCDGTGKCDNCGGSGYTYDYVTGRNDKICSDCNSTGRCHWCNGTGHT